MQLNIILYIIMWICMYRGISVSYLTMKLFLWIDSNIFPFDPDVLFWWRLSYDLGTVTVDYVLYISETYCIWQDADALHVAKARVARCATRGWMVETTVP